jgi:uncharacterized protein
VILDEREWPASLDVPALLAHGFRPRPFRQVVLKLTERCDLACDYCYMFALADQGWQARPARMSREILDRAIARIADHAHRHDLHHLQVILHGGEPLLAGAETIAAVATGLRRALAPDVEPELRIQTNAVRLDRSLLATLAAHGIQIGVSLDGDREANDRHRRRPDGRGSFDAVRQALDLVRERHPELLAGILCTVDLRHDPVETYQALLAFDPPTVDFLLPHGTWSTPPPGIDDPGDPGRATPYGAWLTAVFDRWYPVAARETGVRFFEELLQLLLGGASRVETLGLSPSGVVVIDTDGSIEQVDTLRVAYQGAAGAGLRVQDDSLDAALRHPGILARQLGVEALCEQCRRCPVHRVCGAGYYPHRYRRGRGFLNPSVYCHDLKHLIDHAGRRVAADLAALTAAASPPGPS